MTAITPAEVAKLRLPDGWCLVLCCADEGHRYWEARPVDPDPRRDYPLPGTAVNAELVANGHLPPAALDAVWAAVEGTLQYYSQDQCNDVNRYDNEKDAADDAADAFDESCDDGWDDGVECIEYGIIIRLGGARPTGKTSVDEDGNTVTEYEMVTR